MTGIKARAKAEEVQNLAGHSKNQWKQFMKITRQEAEKLLQKAPASTWIDVKDKDQNSVLEEVNFRLHKNDIPLVTLDVLDWRMPRAMWELRKSNNTSSQAESGQAEPESRPDETQAIRPYYDPARDS